MDYSAARASPVFNPSGDHTASAGGEYVSRRAKITVKELDLHGYTPGCPGCIAKKTGKRAVHNEECRERIEAEVDIEKKKRVKERTNEYVHAKEKPGGEEYLMVAAALESEEFESHDLPASEAIHERPSSMP